MSLSNNNVSSKWSRGSTRSYCIDEPKILRLITRLEVANFFCCDERTISRWLLKNPDFPRPLRIDGSRKQLWNAQSILEFANRGIDAKSKDCQELPPSRTRASAFQKRQIKDGKKPHGWDELNKRFARAPQRDETR